VAWCIDFYISERRMMSKFWDYFEATAIILGLAVALGLYLAIILLGIGYALL
jgi:hypothetical protein